jgi:hypothetical protein
MLQPPSGEDEEAARETLLRLAAVTIPRGAAQTYSRPVLECGMVLAPLVSVPVAAGQSGDQMAAIPITKGLRHACILFDWTDDKEFIRGQLNLIVDRLRVLKSGNSTFGISLKSNPSYFKNTTGAVIWIVLSSHTTSVAKWEQVGRSIGGSEVLAVPKFPAQNRYDHGFTSVTIMFGLEEQTKIDLFTTNRVECGELFKVWPPFSAPFCVFFCKC